MGNLNNMELLQEALDLKSKVENGFEELRGALTACMVEGTRRGLGDFVIVSDGNGNGWPF